MTWATAARGPATWTSLHRRGVQYHQDAVQKCRARTVVLRAGLTLAQEQEQRFARSPPVPGRRAPPLADFPNIRRSASCCRWCMSLHSLARRLTCNFNLKDRLSYNSVIFLFSLCAAVRDLMIFDAPFFFLFFSQQATGRRAISQLKHAEPNGSKGETRRYCFCSSIITYTVPRLLLGSNTRTRIH